MAENNQDKKKILRKIIIRMHKCLKKLSLDKLKNHSSCKKSLDIKRQTQERAEIISSQVKQLQI